MINPNLFTPSHRKVPAQGRKFYLATLVMQGAHYPCRGRFRTATAAEKRARKVLKRWGRLYQVSARLAAVGDQGEAVVA